MGTQMGRDWPASAAGRGGRPAALVVAVVAESEPISERGLGCVLLANILLHARRAAQLLGSDNDSCIFGPFVTWRAWIALAENAVGHPLAARVGDDHAAGSGSAH
jgi:hypothetical protein